MPTIIRFSLSDKSYLSPDGSLDAEAAVGCDGSLTVIKDMELKEPYCGQVPLISGNIAEDITSYYAISEQLPTVVALGISFGERAEIEAAAGFMVQIVTTGERNYYRNTTSDKMLFL